MTLFITKRYIVQPPKIFIDSLVVDSSYFTVMRWEVISSHGYLLTLALHLECDYLYTIPWTDEKTVYFFASGWEGLKTFAKSICQIV